MADSTRSEETKKEFEDFTDVIGGFGKWQKILIGILSWFLIAAASNNLNWPFLTQKGDYWCARPTKYLNLSVEEWRNISAPVEIKGGKTVYSRCEIYDMDDAGKKNNLSKSPCYSWEYDRSRYKRSVIEEWNLVCEDSWLSSLAGSAYYMGMFVSVIVSGQLSDRYGRRPIVISGLVIHVIFGFICTFSPYYWMFAASRLLLSVGISGSILSFFIYVMEVVGSTSREKIMVVQCFSYSLGMLVLTGMSWFLKDWLYIQLCCVLPSILSLLLIRFIPESPRWLLTHDRLHKAEDVIGKIMKINKRRVGDLTQIIEKLHCKIKMNREKRNVNFLDLIRTKELRKMTFILYVLWIAIIFDIYAVSLNADITGGNIFLLFVIFSLLQSCVAGLLHIILPRFGRRHILIFAYLAIGVTSLFVTAVPKDLIWLRIVFVASCRLFISIVLYTIYGFTSELYPTVVRNVGIGSCSTVARIGAVAAPFLKELSEKVNWTIPFVIVGVLNIIVGLCVFPLPETKNVRLADTIQNKERENEAEEKI